MRSLDEEASNIENECRNNELQMKELQHQQENLVREHDRDMLRIQGFYTLLEKTVESYRQRLLLVIDE